MHYLNRVTLQTPESVELEYTLAGIGNRAYALLIDYLVITATAVLLWIIWGIFTSQLFDTPNPITGKDDLGLWLVAIALLLNFLLYTGYFVLFEVLWQGQTPGKRYAKIRVVRDDGRRVGIQQAALRALLRTIDDTLLIGCLMIILGKREKRLGDWVAGTLVVQEESAIAVSDLKISDDAQLLARQLASQSKISAILPDQFATIREYLQRRSALEAKARANLSLQLARQIRTVIELEELPENLTSDTFLEAVYWEYLQQSTGKRD